MPSSKALAVAALLSAATVTAQDVFDTFTVNCKPLTVQRRDPLISPGADGSDHVHAVIGATAFAATLTNEAAVNSVGTTCDKILDHSSYWSPTLYHITSDNKYEPVPFLGSAVYYQNRACDYVAGRTQCPSYKTYFSAAPPKGLRMLSGDKNLFTFNSSAIAQRAVSHHCLGDVDEETNSLPVRHCNTIRSQVTFPSCWDGVNLDSADHKSHMSFPAIGDYNGGVCPQSHPVAIMELFYEWNFDTTKYTDRNFIFASGDKSGYGFHGDFINGWTDQDRLSNAHKTCTGSGGVDAAGCSLNVGTDGSAGHASTQPLQYPANTEDIGTTAPLAQLPNNKQPFGATPQAALKSRAFARDY
ncbi:WSC domain-containing protein [Xylariaceae sp. FL1272]|nr:WSC domain-containing protein [Xylariaceae sp. FL1272]